MVLIVAPTPTQQWQAAHCCSCFGNIVRSWITSPTTVTHGTYQAVRLPGTFPTFPCNPHCSSGTPPSYFTWKWCKILPREDHLIHSPWLQQTHYKLKHWTALSTCRMLLLSVTLISVFLPLFMTIWISFCIASSNELAASTWLIKQAYIFPLIDLLQEEIPFNVLTEPWPRSHLPCIIYTLLAFQFLSSVICISIPPPPERRLHLIGYLHNYFEKESIKKITNRRSE